MKIDKKNLQVYGGAKMLHTTCCNLIKIEYFPKTKLNKLGTFSYVQNFQWPMGVIYLQPFKLRKSFVPYQFQLTFQSSLNQTTGLKIGKIEKTRFTQIEKKTWLQFKFHLNDSNCYRLLFTTRCYCFPVRLYGGPYMQCTNNNFSAKKKNNFSA